MDTISELLTRGVAHAIVKEDLEKKLRSGKKLTVKLGADPTGSKLHIGHAIAIWKLRDLMELGHEIVFIVGDITGMIGDTSDKDSMRPQITKEEVEANMQGWREQVGKILDLTKIRFVYNSEWLTKLDFADVANLAKNFTVAQMIERDNYWKRFESGKPIGLHEFLYPLMQGYDSVAIKADLELGGDDQLFNVLAGRTLQSAFGQEPQNVLTFELLEGTDGRKMSKTYGNGIYISDTPKDIFGKTMSMKDELIIRYFELCTRVPLTEIATIKEKLDAGMNPRDAKIMLAKELVTMYHSAEAANHEEAEFISVFSKGNMPDEIEEKILTLDAMPILDLLVETGLAASKGEGKRLIAQNGIKIDEVTITNDQQVISITTESQILQRGKRQFVKIRTV